MEIRKSFIENTPMIELPKSYARPTPEEIARIQKIRAEKEQNVRNLDPNDPADQKTIEAIKKFVVPLDTNGEEKKRQAL